MPLDDCVTYVYVLGPDSRKVSSLKSEILVLNLRFFLDFSQIETFCLAGIHKRSQAKIFLRFGLKSKTALGVT